MVPVHGAEGSLLKRLLHRLPCNRHAHVPLDDLRYGLNGILYWETCYWQDNPWEKPMSQPDSRSGTGAMVTVTFCTRRRGRSPRRSSPRVQSLHSLGGCQDGIEDWDYFRTLRDRMNTTAKAKRSSPAYRALKDALDQVDGSIRSLTDYDKDPADV